MNSHHDDIIPTDRDQLTAEDVAHYLRTDHTTVTGWLESGHLPGYRLPDRWLVMNTDLQTYLRARQNHPANDADRPAN